MFLQTGDPVSLGCCRHYPKKGLQFPLRQTESPNRNRSSVCAHSSPFRKELVLLLFENSQLCHMRQHALAIVPLQRHCRPLILFKVRKLNLLNSPPAQVQGVQRPMTLDEFPLDHLKNPPPVRHPCQCRSPPSFCYLKDKRCYHKMAVGQTEVPDMEPWAPETWTKTCGPLAFWF